MRKVLTVLAVAAAAAAVATPADADGSRRGWRGSSYGAISRNVITPYYFGYYPGHYSYFAPDPVPPRRYVAAPGCWLWDYGYLYRVC
jgi:hypothetical protein